MNSEFLVGLFTTAHLAIAGYAAAHALLNKHDPRSAWAWILACLLIPAAGALLYLTFGINRIRRHAQDALGASQVVPAQLPADPQPPVSLLASQEVTELVRIARAVTGLPLLAGNDVRLLDGGEAAYAAMLSAIEAAGHQVLLTTYIFDAGVVGERFAAALARAQQRSVQVRVLLDGFGDWRYPRRGSSLLKSHGIEVAKFLPPRLIPPQLHVNMRNHRKLLCIDGAIAFCGGMNIGDHHLVCQPGPIAKRARAQATDLHFRVAGPVVAQCTKVFVEDWRQITGEYLHAVEPTPLAPAGSAMCRVISDGPTESVARFQTVLLGALATAHRSVRIMTPYFVPTAELSSALNATALRGVEVSLLMPQRSNHWWLDAATRRWLSQWSDVPLRVWHRPAPFAHSKLFLVDDFYAIIGSANLDPRSLRLNFELMVEVYDAAFVSELQTHFAAEMRRSRPLDLASLRGRPTRTRLWDSLFWLFSPYL